MAREAILNYWRQKKDKVEDPLNFGLSHFLGCALTRI